MLSDRMTLFCPECKVATPHVQKGRRQWQCSVCGKVSDPLVTGAEVLFFFLALAGLLYFLLR